MTMEILWTLGGEFDGEFPWDPERRWRQDPQRIRQQAAAIDRLPFSGALMAIGVPGAYDPWTMAASVASITQRMRFLIAVYPGLTTPTQLALQALSLDTFTGGRLMLNVVGSNPVTMAAHGVHLEKADRYAMLDEYWRTFTALYAGQTPRPGRFFPVENPSSFLAVPPVQDPHPPLWGAGGSPEGIATVVSLVDTYLAQAGTPQEMARRTAAAAEVAAGLGIPTPNFGCSLGVLVRETEEEAWLAAERKLAHMSAQWLTTESMGWPAALAADPDQLDDRERRCIQAVCEGRMPTARDLEFYPNMWTGPIVRAGIDFLRQLALPSTMLIGSAEQVAERMHEIQDLAGIDRFILWAPPFIEEAYRVSDLLLPLLDVQPTLTTPAPSLRAGGTMAAR